jgi:hypothetical protein
MSGRPSPDTLLRRLAVACCPAPDREWLEAIFAERGQVEGSVARGKWSAGAMPTLITILRLRFATLVPVALRVGAVLSLLLAVAAGVAANLGYEGLRIDDDAYLLLAYAATAAFVAASGIALIRIYTLGSRPPRSEP